MTNKEAIKYLQQIYPNGGHCWLDEQRIEAITMAVKALQEEPVSNSDWLTELQEKLDNATPEQLEELWNKYNGVDEEEPISEDLIEELKKIVNIRECVSQGVPVIKIARHFAEWQKEQFEKNRLKHCNSITNEQAELEQKFLDEHLDKHQRMPTFLDAIEYGMRLQCENMTKEAIDVEVKVDAGGYPYIDKTIELYDYDKDAPLAKKGDKYKVVLIKGTEL